MDSLKGPDEHIVREANQTHERRKYFQTQSCSFASRSYDTNTGLFDAGEIKTNPLFTFSKDNYTARDGNLSFQPIMVS